MAFILGGGPTRHHYSEGEEIKEDIPTYKFSFEKYYNGMKVLKCFNTSTGFKIEEDKNFTIVNEWWEEEKKDETFHYFRIKENDNNIPLYLFYDDETYIYIRKLTLKKNYIITIFEILLLLFLWLNIFKMHIMVILVLLIPFSWLMIELLICNYNFRKRFNYFCGFWKNHPEI